MKKKKLNYIGIDGCRAGWFVVAANKSLSDYSFQLIESIEELEKIFFDIKRIMIDIPIGLSNLEPRAADIEARKLLTKRKSSVFPAPLRQLIKIKDYNLAQKLSRQLTGKGISKQAFNIFRKVEEVDDFLSKESNNRDNYFEFHPEIGFKVLNNNTEILESKKTKEGQKERLLILEKHFPESGKLKDEALEKYRRKDLALDDILDALCAAICSTITKQNRVPKNYEYDSTGKRMNVFYPGL